MNRHHPAGILQQAAADVDKHRRAAFSLKDLDLQAVWLSGGRKTVTTVHGVYAGRKRSKCIELS